MEWYFAVLRKYVVFSGRARRREYWMFQLWQLLIILALSVVTVGIARATFSPNLALLVPTLYGLATFLPALAVQVRRLHDTDHSGWACLISLIPLVGPIILFVWDVQDGTPGDNRFGPNPKLAASSTIGGGGQGNPAMGYVAPPLPPDRR